MGWHQKTLRPAAHPFLFNRRYAVKKIAIILIYICYTMPSFAVDDITAIQKGRSSAVFIEARYAVPNAKGFVPQYGTGFVVDTKKSPGLIIVTNKHILQRRVKDDVVIPSEILLKVNFSEKEPTYWSAKIIALHDASDIGLLYPIAPVKLPADAVFKKSEDRIYLSWKHNSFLLEDDVIDDNEIKEGLEVLFSGYPLNLGSKYTQNFPVTRKGIIAQVIPNDNELLMDGFASHGNSGSPIYCLIGGNLKLVGIQQGAYNDMNVGYDEAGNLTSVSSYNSGLSILIKASVIKDFVHKVIQEGKYKGDWSH